VRRPRADSPVVRLALSGFSSPVTSARELLSGATSKHLRGVTTTSKSGSLPEEDNRGVDNRGVDISRHEKAVAEDEEKAKEELSDATDDEGEDGGEGWGLRMRAGSSASDRRIALTADFLHASARPRRAKSLPLLRAAIAKTR